MWYAVMNSEDDPDWGFGNDDRATAIEMAKATKAHHIEVIDGEGNAAICVERLWPGEDY